uniref:adhesion G protein-coupled receptor E3-like isoform X2 n=1 Tax=Ciona intestinalis TaxID=7719 RepID=UPI000EF509C9|nr:adhesion G protein-coupled receptor E3-like isoform X2 [Ciona intestinalis]|eukprot:XP_026695604.1 adhesion G protein-coupled receptor E3-like isoform X2 [Ciona intestinalis]
MAKKLAQPVKFGRNYSIHCRNNTPDATNTNGVCERSNMSIVRRSFLNTTDLEVSVYCYSQNSPSSAPSEPSICRRFNSSFERTLNIRWECEVIHYMNNITNTFRCGGLECILCDDLLSSHFPNQTSAKNPGFPASTPTPLVSEPSPAPPIPSQETVIKTFEKFANQQFSLDNISSNSIESQQQVAALIANFEQNVSTVLSYLPAGTQLSSPLMNIKVAEIRLNRINENQTIRFDKASFRIPSREIADHFLRNRNRNINEIKIVAASWQGLNKSFPSPNHKDVPQSICRSKRCNIYLPVNTSVVSLAYYNKHGLQLMDLPVAMVIDVSNDYTALQKYHRPPAIRLQGINRDCVWWNNKKFRWSRAGCERIKLSNGPKFQAVTCRCNHTTTFATLLITRSIAIPRWIYELSATLEIINIIFLIITIILVAVARSSTGIEESSTINSDEVRNNRAVNQISLCLAIMGLHFCILLSPNAVKDTGTCYTVAVLTHYFLLASALWLLNEGLTMVLKTQDHFSFSLNYKVLTTVQLLLAWVVPFVFVIAAVTSLKENYLEISASYRIFSRNLEHAVNATPYTKMSMYDRCFFNNSQVVYYVAIPLAIIITANVILILKMIFVIYRLSRLDNRRRQSLTAQTSHSTMHYRIKRHAHWKSVLKAFCILMPVSSIPWMFLLLQVVRNYEETFIGIHTVVNGFQGVLIFYVYCIHTKEDRGRITRKWKRSLPGRIFERHLENPLKKCCPPWKRVKQQKCEVEIRFDNVYPNSDETGNRLTNTRGSNVTVTTQVPSME